MLLMPESTVLTSGMFQSQSKASSTGDLSVALSSTSCTFGGRSTKKPPRSGSMMTTPRPRSAASCKPLSPAWNS